MAQRKEAVPIRFDAELSMIDTAAVLRLPETASALLPSRGQVAVRGTVNDADFETVLEPDGHFGHWMKVSRTLQRAARIGTGDRATVDLVVANEWPEPRVPDDLAAALVSAPPSVQGLWGEITPMARWEWVRWVNATRDHETRRRCVDVSISKLKNGKRRPCCFNLSSCTDPELSRSGKLMEPSGDRS